MILVDSDVLICHLRGLRPATDWLLRARTETGRLAASVITVAEIAGGMRSSERQSVTRLLATLNIVPISERIAWRAGEMRRTYRRSHPGVGLPDYLVAATVELEGLELATLNVRHFPMFDGLTAPFEV